MNPKPNSIKLWRYAGDREYNMYVPCVYNIAKMVEKIDPKSRVEFIELEIGEIET